MNPLAMWWLWKQSTEVNQMYFSYEESVLDHADADGNLDHAQAQRLLADHGFTLEDVYEDNHGVSWVALDERNAEALLAWLGY